MTKEKVTNAIASALVCTAVGFFVVGPILTAFGGFSMWIWPTVTFVMAAGGAVIAYIYTGLPSGECSPKNTEPA